jgi:hypothetical protein
MRRPCPVAARRSIAVRNHTPGGAIFVFSIDHRRRRGVSFALVAAKLREVKRIAPGSGPETPKRERWGGVAAGSGEIPGRIGGAARRAPRGRHLSRHLSYLKAQ